MVLENYGQPLTYEQQTAAADTALTILDSTWRIKIWKLAYDGGSTAPTVGALLVGASSGATAIVLEVPTPATGAWATNDAAGFIYIHNWNGITWTNNENVNHVAPTTNTAAADIFEVNVGQYESDKKVIDTAYGSFRDGAEAQCALITVETQNARIMTDGTAPTPATHANGLTNRGLAFVTNTDWLIRDPQQIRQIRTCNATAGSNHVRRIICYF